MLLLLLLPLLFNCILIAVPKGNNKLKSMKNEARGWKYT